MIEGHRRLAAALKAGLDGGALQPGRQRAGDDAGQFLDMAVLANSEQHRQNFTPRETA